MVRSVYRYARNTVFWVWIVPALGMLFSVLAALYVMRDLQRDNERQFAFAADQVAIKVRERLESYELILRGGAALFESSETVTRDEWRRFVNKLDADRIVPGVQGIGFAERIPPERLAAHIAAVRAEGFPGYDVNPPGSRDFYTAIVYLEPLAGINLRAFGYDMFSEPVRQAAMARARDTGLASLSHRVTLVQETSKNPQPGVLMYVPVYRHDMPVDTVEQRRIALQGWTYSPYRISDLMAGILQGWESKEGRYIDLHIYDGAEATPEARIFDGWWKERPAGHTPFYQQRKVDFYGNVWLLEFDRISSAPGIDYTPVWLVLACGLVITGLLFEWLRSLRETRDKATRMAEELTAEVRQRETELLEAQRIGKIGNWKLDLASNHIEWSEALERIFGVGPETPALSLEEHQRFFTEDSWGKLLKVLAQVLADHQPYEEQLEVIAADGAHRWLLVRGEYFSGEDGRETGLRGTAVDVTERVQAAMRIASLTRLYAALSECNIAVVQCRSEAELFERLCRLVVDAGGMTMAWLGLIDEASGRLLPVYSAGEGTDYLDGIEVSVRADDSHGLGPTGTAARENRPVWVDDFQSSAMTAVWHAQGQTFQWKASAAVPICRAGKPIGALTFYSRRGGWFDDGTRHLLEQMTSNISFAIDKIAAEAEAQAKEAGLVESEQRFRSLVEQSIAGAFIIQDNQVIYANPRAREILGYLPDDDISRLTLLDIIAPKDRESVGLLVRKLMTGELAKVDALFSAIRKDGSFAEVGTNSVAALYQGRPAIIGMMQDISDRKMAEDHIRRYATQLEHTFFQTVSLITTLSEMRDAYTAGHERRVAEIAVAIGREMGLTEDRLVGLRVGGYLHDVGKITVPSEILAKPGKLTPIEYSLIQQHAQAGYDVLKGVDFPWPVAQIAWQHHERIDGSGYPQGLKGDDIILEARITAVADVVESMASHRPYRPGLGIDKALAEIERGAGTAYDPLVACACLQLFREKGYVIPA